MSKSNLNNSHNTSVQEIIGLKNASTIGFLELKWLHDHGCHILAEQEEDV